ncbi:MAG: hypothetical protein L0Y72_24765 [Gemmataceae bacterium]|nr:hypothetical protein [Gemmataceae bacterium]MCI0742258.1 hypothetical protein [Gemmataceae bacterium]
MRVCFFALSMSAAGFVAMGPMTRLAVPAQPPDKERPALGVKDLRFNDGSVHALFLKLDAAAGALAKPGWTVLPYRNRTYRGGPTRYVAQWCQSAGPKGECICSRDPIPSHYVQLHGNALNMAGDQIDGLEIHAGYVPRKGWGARLEYRTYNGKAAIGEMFSLFFFHDDFNQTRPVGQGKWALELGNSYFTTTKRYGDLTYGLQVSMYGDPKTWMGDTRTPRDRDVERYLSSPESFLAAALAEFDALEANARKHIPSGAAVRTVVDGKGARSDNPPKEVAQTVENRLTEKQLTAILGEALTDIEQRRKLVRAHFREMHAAARTAFPLLECIMQKGK